MATGYMSTMDASGKLKQSKLPATLLGRLGYRCGLVIFGLLWVFLSSTLCGCGAMNGYVMNRSGRRYYDKGNYEYARYEFERALMDDPHNANYAFNVGRAMEREGESENAEMMYQHALTLNPSHLPSYHSLASMLREQGRTAESQELLLAWAETQPYNYEAQQSAAIMSRQQGDFASAQRYSAQARRNVPYSESKQARQQRLYQASSRLYGPQRMQTWGQYSQQYPQQQQMVMQNGQAGMYSPRFPNGPTPSLQMARTMPLNDPTMMGGPVVPPRTMASTPVYQQSFPQSYPQMESQPGLSPTPAVPNPQQFLPPTLPSSEPTLLPELPAPTSQTGPQAHFSEQQFVYQGGQPVPGMIQEFQGASIPASQYPATQFPSPQYPPTPPPTMQSQGSQQVMLPTQGLAAPTATQQVEMIPPQPNHFLPVQNASSQNSGTVVPAVQAF